MASFKRRAFTPLHFAAVCALLLLFFQFVLLIDIIIYFRKLHGSHRCGNAEATKYHTHTNLGYLSITCAHHRASISNDEIHSRFVRLSRLITHNLFFFNFLFLLFVFQSRTHRRMIYLDISKTVVILLRMR